MEKKDRDFLVRANRVSENYERRIAKLRERIAESEATLLFGGDVGLSELLETLDKLDRYKALQAEYQAHTQRVAELREQHRRAQALNKLCADANKLAGTDGANFSTKAGLVLKGEPDESGRI